MSNPTHFLDEIAFSIKTQDAIKLKVLLNEIPRLDDALIHQLLWKITGQEAYLSIPLILYISLYQPDTCLRYPKLEEILNDKFTSVREPFDIYEKLEEEFHPIFLEMWLSLAANKTDRDFEQFFNCGSKLNRMKILKYFYSKPQKTVHKITEGALKSDSINEVKTAVQAILKKPYDSIWPKLLVLIGLDADLDKLIIISYASSSKPDFNILIELLDSRHTRVRALVIDCFMQMKDHPKLFNALCDSLNSNYRALSKTILTLNLLRDFADAAAGQVIRQLIQAHPGDPNIRFCAYEALGAIHVGAGIFTLTTGLADPVEAVQVAAAKALEGNYSTAVKMGVTNFVLAQSNPLATTETLLTGECYNTISDIIEKNEVKELVEQVLKTLNGTELYHKWKTHFSKTAAPISLDEEISIPTSKEIWAVDDSVMIVKMFQKYIEQAGCAFRGFLKAEDVLQELQTQKPALLFSDLNMPGMSGLELATEIRKFIAPDQLNIVLATTATEVGAESDGVELFQRHIQKPFTAEIIKEVIEQLTTVK